MADTQIRFGKAVAVALTSSLALGLALAGGSAALAAAPAAQAFYDRTVMSVADARCRLFTPDLAAALDSARDQARSAALRSGVNQAVLAQTARRAEAKADAVACGSSDLATAAGRVRDAFAGYARLSSMTFPGDAAAWRAVRRGPADTPFWRLSQTTTMNGRPLTFGLTGGPGQGRRLVAMTDFGGAAPYAARLVARDPARAPEPYLDSFGSRGGAMGLQDRVPPRTAARVFSAEARSAADPRLLPGGAKAGVVFVFPDAAADAIAALDPREAVILEFLFTGQGRDGVRQAFIEVGDFAAGRAFLAVARR